VTRSDDSVRRVKFGTTEIAYRIRRGQRQKTAAIAVDPRHGVVVTAPMDTPVARLDTIVRRKAAWILARMRAVGRLEGAPCPREFVSGESCLYLGRHYRLKVAAGRASDARLAGKWLRVEGPKEARDTRAIRRAVERWYRARAEGRLPERVMLLAKRVGVPLPRLLVRDQPKRWGSCDARGALRINWRIIQAPMRLVDYVIAHELAHLRERNHTRAFWSLIGKVIPDYDRRRDELRRVGSRLVW
jgi:predicted metal-dependent hydrolase